MKMIICPKCKSKKLILTELWHNHAITFEYENGLVTDNGTASEGTPYKVEGWCKQCDYTWTIRGVKQINDIMDEDN